MPGFLCFSNTEYAAAAAAVAGAVAVAVVVFSVVVVEWLYYSKRIIIVTGADLTDFFRRFSSEKCVFLFHVQ